MTRIVPHDQIFKRGKMFDSFGTLLIYVSSIISIALIAIPKLQVEIKLLMNAINCVLIFIIVVFDLIYNYIFFEAGKTKRLDFIDNSFGVDFLGSRSQGYFSNENLSVGMYKMAVNCFENSFFSYQVSGKMIAGAWLKAAFVLALFVFTAAMGNYLLINLLFQLTLPIMLIQQAIKITLFYTRIHTVHEGFRQLFNDIKQQGTNLGKDPEILKLVLDYQTTLSWGVIPLSEKIFNTNNATWSRKWEDLKRIYSI